MSSIAALATIPPELIPLLVSVSCHDMADDLSSNLSIPLFVLMFPMFVPNFSLCEAASTFPTELLSRRGLSTSSNLTNPWTFIFRIFSLVLKARKISCLLG